MLRRRRHVQILVFVVKLDFRIRIIKGSLKSIISNRDLRKGGIMILLGPRKAKTIVSLHHEMG